MSKYNRSHTVSFKLWKSKHRFLPKRTQQNLRLAHMHTPGSEVWGNEYEISRQWKY